MSTNFTPNFDHYDHHIEHHERNGEVWRLHFNTGTPERLLIDAHRRLLSSHRSLSFSTGRNRKIKPTALQPDLQG